MKTFDYASAWHEVVKPLWEAQPEALRALVERDDVRKAAQVKDLTVPIPEAVRVVLEATGSEALALFAQVAHNYGHWSPCNSLPSGAGWKIAHMVDQVLRARLGFPKVPSDTSGTSFQVHAGVVRACFSTKDSWQWVELAPAVESWAESLKNAAPIPSFNLGGSPGAKKAARIEYEAQAQEFCDKHRDGGLAGLPAPWPRLLDLTPYMREPGQEASAKAARDPAYFARKAEELKARHAEDLERHIENEALELEGKLWLLAHGFEIENWIYYTHARTWCYGWRTPVGDADASRWLDIASEFPYEYEIKRARAMA